MVSSHAVPLRFPQTTSFHMPTGSNPCPSSYDTPMVVHRVRVHCMDAIDRG